MENFLQDAIKCIKFIDLKVCFKADSLKNVGVSKIAGFVAIFTLVKVALLARTTV